MGGGLAVGDWGSDREDKRERGGSGGLYWEIVSFSEGEGGLLYLEVYVLSSDACGESKGVTGVRTV